MAMLCVRMSQEMRKSKEVKAEFNQTMNIP